MLQTRRAANIDEWVIELRCIEPGIECRESHLSGDSDNLVFLLTEAKRPSDRIETGPQQPAESLAKNNYLVDAITRCEIATPQQGDAELLEELRTDGVVTQPRFTV